MTSRIVQLLARYIAAGLMALAGWLGAGPEVEGEVANVAGAVAAAVVAVGLLAFDWLIHRLRSARWLSVLLLGLVLLLPAAGCSLLGQGQRQGQDTSFANYTVTVQGVAIFGDGREVSSGPLAERLTISVAESAGQSVKVDAWQDASAGAEKSDQATQRTDPQIDANLQVPTPLPAP